MKIKNLAILFVSSFSQAIFAQDLIETYQLAKLNDPISKGSYYSKLSAGESRSQSIAQMLPTLSASTNNSRERLNDKKVRTSNQNETTQSAGIQYFWDHRFSINFTQPVFHWDHWVQLSQSNNQIAQADAEYQAQAQELIVKTTEAYFDILAAGDNIKFIISEQKSIERQLDQAQQRFDVGLVAITDVYEAQAAYDQSLADLIDAENLLDDRKEALREIIGDYDADLLNLVEEIELTPPTPNNIDEWSKISETNNFDIIAALNQAEIRRKDIDIQKSGHLPTLDIVADYNLQDSGSTFGRRGDSESVGIQLNIPLFEGGGVISRTRQAEFDYLNAKENLLSTKRRVKHELRNSFRDVISSLSRVNALKATVKSAQNALDATEAGFSVGTRTMVDVLSEQRFLFEAKRDYARSRYDYFVNGIKLKDAASSLSEQDLEIINQYLKH